MFVGAGQSQACLKEVPTELHKVYHKQSKKVVVKKKKTSTTANKRQ